MLANWARGAAPWEKPDQLSDECQDEIRAHFYEHAAAMPARFYHTMDLGDGVHKGAWDLRENVDSYLGNIDFAGLRVLEFGPASGFLTMTMEEAGAEVVSLEIPPGSAPDLLPAPADPPNLTKRFANSILGFQNAWWYVHKRRGLNAKILYADIYDLPTNIGRFDVSTFCSILLHLSNPFAALRQAAGVTDKALVVTEPFIPKLENSGLPVMEPMNDPDPTALVNWWRISSAACVRMCQRLGFTETTIYKHRAPYRPLKEPDKVYNGEFFTVLALRPNQSVPLKQSD